jgi:protein SCO1/2
MTTDRTPLDHGFALSRRRFLATAAGGAVAAALAGCGLENASSTEPEGAAWGGELQQPPLAMPDVTFTGMDGKPFDLRAETKGKLTLVFPGYTHCPDVCPVFLNIISGALDKLGQAEGGDTRVVFVAIDPTRDTPEVLKEYLSGIHPNLMGVTPDAATLAAFDDALYLPEPVYGTPDENGDYEVGHLSKAFAFLADGKAHRFYPPNTRQTTWVRDLPRLAAGTYR